MLIETLSQVWRRALVTNATDASSYPTRTLQKTAPTLANNPGLVQCSNGGSVAQNLVKIIPFGVGSANDTFTMRVLQWHTDDKFAHAWYPLPIGDFTCTLSTFAGVDGTQIDSNQLICDTITLTSGFATANVSCELCSNAANVPAHAVLSIKGAYFLEFIFNMGSSATSANALISMM